jgi:hypothetical protein
MVVEILNSTGYMEVHKRSSRFRVGGGSVDWPNKAHRRQAPRHRLGSKKTTAAFLSDLIHQL